MPPDDGPQAEPEVQAPQSIRDRVLSATREQLAAREEPQAPEDGTGEVEPAPESDPEPAPVAETGGEATEQAADEPESVPEIDWSDPDARQEALEAQIKERLENQKRSLTAEIEQERQRTRAQLEQARQEGLLKELDELKDTDPEAYAERIDTDRDARRAIDARDEARRGNPQQQAVQMVATVLQQQLETVYELRPEARTLEAENPDAFKEATSPEKGGWLGYIDRTARKAGEKEGVEKFKSSSTYKEALAEAEARGRRAALADLGLGSPETSPGSPPGDALPELPTDPKRRAVAMAQRQMAARGTPIRVNLDAIAPAGRNGR